MRLFQNSFQSPTPFFTGVNAPSFLSESNAQAAKWWHLFILGERVEITEFIRSSTALFVAVNLRHQGEKVTIDVLKPR